MPAAVGFIAGAATVIALILGGISGIFVRMLAAEDDLDPDDDPFDTFPPRPQETP